MIDSYNDAVQQFVWPAEASNANTDIIVHAIADQIKAAKQIKNFLPNGSNLPLSAIYTIVVKDLDRKYQTNTPSLVYNATDEEKAIAKRVFVDLSKQIYGDSEVDLKTATLLFGIKKIQEFIQSQPQLASAQTPAKTEVAPAPVVTVSVEQLQGIVDQMQNMRAQLADSLAKAQLAGPGVTDFLKTQIDKVDALIAQKLAEIQSMKDVQARVAELQ